MTLDVWEFYEQAGQSNRSSLSEKQREVLAVCDLRQEVASGGFDSYFRYWGADSASTAVAALAEILGSDWADLLGSAMDLFGDPFPADCDERADQIDEKDLEGRLEEMNERFQELEGAIDADACLNAYLTNHLGDEL